MVVKVIKNNYRQFYKEYYRVEFSDKFDIHHIDMNRDNNMIQNLILLPRIVHSNYHTLENLVTISTLGNEQILFSIASKLNNAKTNFKAIYDICNEIYYWYGIKKEIDIYINGCGYLPELSHAYQAEIDKYIFKNK